MVLIFIIHTSEYRKKEYATVNTNKNGKSIKLTMPINWNL